VTDDVVPRVRVEDLLGQAGDTRLVDQARRELPAAVDLVEHAAILQALGIDPDELRDQPRA
jgi:hypothetical protein